MQFTKNFISVFKKVLDTVNFDYDEDGDLIEAVNFEGDSIRIFIFPENKSFEVVFNTSEGTQVLDEIISKDLTDLYNKIDEVYWDSFKKFKQDASQQILVNFVK